MTQLVFFQLQDFHQIFFNADGKVGIPFVFDVVVRPACQMLRYSAPLAPVPTILLEDNLLFLFGPGPRLDDIWIQMIMPSFSTLLTTSAW